MFASNEWVTIETVHGLRQSVSVGMGGHLVTGHHAGPARKKSTTTRSKRQMHSTKGKTRSSRTKRTSR